MFARLMAGLFPRWRRYTLPAHTTDDCWCGGYGHYNHREIGEAVPVEARPIGFPHCDQRILHAPGECEYCNDHPDWQALREAWGIAFTGHPPRGDLPQCAQPITGLGYPAVCQQPEGHPEGECKPYPVSDILPCPADFARPPGADNDHRRWGGNKPTSATGDPTWPRESFASQVMYSDQGGRQPWPLPERLRRRLTRLIRRQQ